MFRACVLTPVTLGVAAILWASAVPVHAVLTDGIVVIGDSYSAEHRFIANRFKHRNWVEQLGDNSGGDVVSGQYNFGSYTTDFFVHGEPRGAGFEFNWAKSGATTDDVLSADPNANQIDGAVGQLNTPGNSVGIISIGVNDFFNSFDPNDGGYVDPSTATDGAVANIQTIIDQTTATGGNLVLANIVDRASWPTHAGADPAQRDAVRAAIQLANLRITAYANGLGIPVVDQFRLLDDMSTGTFDFAGLAMLPGLEAGSPSGGSSPEYVYADDAHPGSVYHGLFANMLLTALDIGHENILAGDVPLLTDQNILNNAYAKFGGNAPVAQPFNFDYSEYVITNFSAVLGDADNDGGVTGSDLVAVQTSFGGTGAADGFLLGDANDDGQVTGADLIAVQQNFGAALPAGAALSHLPEPTTLSMYCIGALMLRRRGRWARA